MARTSTNRTDVVAAVALALVAAVGCGTEEPSAEDFGVVTSPIINGTTLASDDVGMVRLRYTNAKGAWACSGTLLNASWILTAAHCADGTMSSYKVIVGASTTASPAQVDRIIVHPEASFYSNMDVALLRVNMTLRNPATGRPFSNTLYPGTAASLVGKTVDCRGYGAYTQENTGAGVLRQAYLPVTASTWDTFRTNKNAAGQVQWSGDSGGSCTLTTGGVRHVLGVFFLGFSGDEGPKYGVSLASAAFRDWVKGYLPPKVVADYTGDGRDDYAMWLRDSAEFSIKASNGGTQTLKPLGGLSEVPLNGDWDGDGKTDHATFRPTDRRWSILYSKNNQLSTRFFGDAGDKPLVGDFDGDGKTDLVTFGGGIFKVRESTGASWTREWSAPDELPVIGDYNGDGRDDVGTFKNGWWTAMTTAHFDYVNETIGAAGDKPVPGDYDGDRISDVAVWRPSNGQWTIKRSSDQATTTKTWGVSTDLPVPADYDGDRKTDIAYYRPSNRTWNIVKSTNNTTYSITWGASNSVPVQAPLGNR